MTQLLFNKINYYKGYTFIKLYYLSTRFDMSDISINSVIWEQKCKLVIFYEDVNILSSANAVPVPF